MLGLLAALGGCAVADSGETRTTDDVATGVTPTVADDATDGLLGLGDVLTGDDWEAIRVGPIGTVDMPAGTVEGSPLTTPVGGLEIDIASWTVSTRRAGFTISTFAFPCPVPDPLAQRVLSSQARGQFEQLGGRIEHERAVESDGLSGLVAIGTAQDTAWGDTVGLARYVTDGQHLLSVVATGFRSDDDRIRAVFDRMVESFDAPDRRGEGERSCSA